MSDHEIDAPSLWDRAEKLQPRTEDGDYDWDALIGEAPPSGPCWARSRW